MEEWYLQHAGYVSDSFPEALSEEAGYHAACSFPDGVLSTTVCFVLAISIGAMLSVGWKRSTSTFLVMSVTLEEALGEEDGMLCRLFLSQRCVVDNDVLCVGTIISVLTLSDGWKTGSSNITVIKKLLVKKTHVVLLVPFPMVCCRQ